jgi:hypothetical protein
MALGEEMRRGGDTAHVQDALVPAQVALLVVHPVEVEVINDRVRNRRGWQADEGQCDELVGIRLPAPRTMSQIVLAITVFSQPAFEETGSTAAAGVALDLAIGADEIIRKTCNGTPFQQARQNQGGHCRSARQCKRAAEDRLIEPPASAHLASTIGTPLLHASTETPVRNAKTECDFLE